MASGTSGGRAEFVFTRAPAGETYLRRQYCTYPYHVCRLHRFAGDPAGMATLYVQSCAGGVFEGDRLLELVTLESGARAHVTTQAASIIHGMEANDARVEISVEAGADSFLELLPDPLILFSHSRLTTQLHVRMHPSAIVILCDSFLQHDPAAGSSVFDSFSNELRVETFSGSLIFLDRFAITGAVMAAGLPGVNGTYRGHGSITVLVPERRGDELVKTLRDAVEKIPGIYAGASTLPGGAGAWLRVLAEDGAALRGGLDAAWRALRQLLTGRLPRPRRK